MGKTVWLNVDGVKKKSTEIQYNDLVILYRQFIELNKRIPKTSEGLSKNNLPQCRIIKNILEREHITYNDFILQFNISYHIRTESVNYDDMVQRFISLCNSNGTTLTTNDLCKNKYGLPSASWFVDHCPDKNVKNYNDFINWCNLQPYQNKSKEYIAKELFKLQEYLNRPLTTKDINKKNIGFSMIVIKRIWGSFQNCKTDIGLLDHSNSHPKPFLEYKEKIDKVLKEYVDTHKSPYITWKEIESNKEIKIEHKSMVNAFYREGVDFYTYVQSFGLLMNPSLFSFHHMFDDGERVVSSMEYKVSLFLKELNLKYNIDYKRDVMYKNIIHNLKAKINFDYHIYNKYVIEVAGIIHNPNEDWENIVYSTRQEIDYKNNLMHKKTLLSSNNIPFLFLFPEDFDTNIYKNKIISLLNKENHLWDKQQNIVMKLQMKCGSK